MVALTLALASSERELLAAHETFVRDAAKHSVLGIDLLRRTYYWLFDPRSRTFSPSKFSAFSGMNFDLYARSRTADHAGAYFNGGVARRSIAQILGDYVASQELADKLSTWIESIFGADALVGITTAKWRFFTLHATAGLMSLAGGWEGSDELVDDIATLRRSPGREPPAV